MSVHDLGEASAIDEAASGVAGVITVALVPLLIGLRCAAAGCRDHAPRCRPTSLSTRPSRLGDANSGCMPADRCGEAARSLRAGDPAMRLFGDPAVAAARQ